VNQIPVGVAFFDVKNSSTLGGGWYSINGEKAKMFDSPMGDLSPQVFWITNLGFQETIDNSLRGTNHIRDDCYFKMPLKTIGIEVGVYESTIIPNAVEVLAGVASRTINLAKTVMPSLRYGNFSLREAIYSSLNLSDQQTDQGLLYQDALQAAFQENSVITSRRGNYGASEIVRFVSNRVLHAEAVLSYPSPAGNIRLISEKMSVDDFLAMDHPAIAEVLVDSSSVENPGLLAFGAQYSSTGVLRNWMAQPEAFFMAKMGAKITIFNVLAFSSSERPPQLPEALTSNALIRNSYSAGLFADNFLGALMSSRINEKKSNKFKYPKFFPSRAVYMRSVDRMLSFVMASALESKGIRVSAYGFGLVNARVSESELMDAVMIGADLGFSILATPSDRFNRG
jgi:hypothetical protein